MFLLPQVSVSTFHNSGDTLGDVHCVSRVAQSIPPGVWRHMRLCLNMTHHWPKLMADLLHDALLYFWWRFWKTFIYSDGKNGFYSFDSNNHDRCNPVAGCRICAYFANTWLLLQRFRLIYIPLTSTTCTFDLLSQSWSWQPSSGRWFRLVIDYPRWQSSYRQCIW